ncbi:hypothetical protein FOZ62_003456 [Perkinsus olseni]|uniref:Uncharacterized protein n=1 Tax=Perkinsus olseni TaxID=32597 RepID=A0A7J6TIY7_PEROL|nr:hypothetical protein FOZ62_003456 [Perkinsus olseni]
MHKSVFNLGRHLYEDGRVVGGSAPARGGLRETCWLESLREASEIGVVAASIDPQSVDKLESEGDTRAGSASAQQNPFGHRAEDSLREQTAAQQFHQEISASFERSHCIEQVRERSLSDSSQLRPQLCFALLVARPSLCSGSSTPTTGFEGGAQYSDEELCACIDDKETPVLDEVQEHTGRR